METQGLGGINAIPGYGALISFALTINDKIREKAP